MNSNLISKAVRYALVAGAVTAVASPAVFAQDTSQAASSDQSANAAQLGKIEVTGTRIKRTTLETAQPVTIVTAKQIKESGFASIGDVLQSLSTTGTSLNNQINNGNDGSNTLDLRNLGTNRLLVLVNGRRWAADIGNTVDLYTIPTSIIDHVEILQDGASAIYGSDAIAGVVNIITVKNFTGAEADAYMGIYKGDGHTDGKKQTYDFTIGSSGDRAGAMMNVSYTNEQAIWAGNRDISNVSIWGVGGGSSAIPGGRFILFGGQGQAGNACQAAKAKNGSISVSATSSGVFDVCDLTNGQPGTTTNPGLAQFRDYSGSSDRYNFAPQNYLLAPSERTSFFAQGHYDLADNVTFTTEVLFNNRSSSQALAPAPLFLGVVNNGELNNGGNIGVAAGNPYNPFGVDLVPYLPSDAANFAAWCSKYGSASCATNPNTTSLYGLFRRPLEAGNRIYTQNYDTYHWAGGLKGYFNMLGGEWDWDVNANYSRNYDVRITDGQFNTSRIQEALSQNCGSPSDASCVPLNVFGGAGAAGGTMTPTQLAYVQFQEHNIITSNTRDYTGNISGNLFDLPAGPVGMALGYEYLETDGFYAPDPLVSTGNSTDNVTTPTSGREATNAQYFEFNIPLVSNVAFMKDVSLDLADRFSQFKWGGVGPGEVYVPGADHAHTGRAALRWQVNDDLLLRASWSQGFRLPSISEFYAGAANNFPAVVDPCAGGSTAATSAVVAANCAANGHPYSAGNQQANGQIQTLAGGNANMTPEKSISKTVGFVYNPDWLPGYDLSIDYYDIFVGNLVGSLGPQTILNGCYFANNQDYCNLIGVAGKGTTNAQINSINNLNRNVGIVLTDGFDVSTHYKLPSTSMGDFKLGLDVTFLKRYDSTSPDPAAVGGYDTYRSAGWVNLPKRRATLSLDWHYGDWSANYSLYFVDHTIEPCQNATASPTTSVPPCTWSGGANGQALRSWGTVATVYIIPGLPPSLAGTIENPLAGYGQNHIGATTYHDVSATYHMDSWNTDFTFGIQNLWAKQAPFSMSSFANSYQPYFNRVPGRFFYGRVAVKF